MLFLDRLDRLVIERLGAKAPGVRNSPGTTRPWGSPVPGLRDMAYMPVRRGPSRPSPLPVSNSAPWVHTSWPGVVSPWRACAARSRRRLSSGSWTTRGVTGRNRLPSRWHCPSTAPSRCAVAGSTPSSHWARTPPRPCHGHEGGSRRTAARREALFQPVRGETAGDEGLAVPDALKNCMSYLHPGLNRVEEEGHVRRQEARLFLERFRFVRRFDAAGLLDHVRRARADSNSARLREQALRFVVPTPSVDAVRTVPGTAAAGAVRSLCRGPRHQSGRPHFGAQGTARPTHPSTGPKRMDDATVTAMTCRIQTGRGERSPARGHKLNAEGL